MRKIPKAFRDTYSKAAESRKFAILAFCGECMGYETNPQNCTAPDCPLFRWRGWGKERFISDQQREALRESGRKSRLTQLT